MTAVAEPRREPRVELRCPGCDHAFSASARYARDIRSGSCRGLCPACKHPKQMARVEVTYALKQWWLKRYSVEELREMAAALDAYLQDLELRQAA